MNFISNIQQSRDNIIKEIILQKVQKMNINSKSTITKESIFNEKSEQIIITIHK